MAQQQWRQGENDQRGGNADDDQAEQNGKDNVDFVVFASGRRVCYELPKIARLDSVEEERAIVTNRSYVIRVGIVEAAQVGGKKQLAKRRLGVGSGKIDDLHFGGSGSRLDAIDIRCAEGSARDQDGVLRSPAFQALNVFAYHGNMASGIVLSDLLECGAREGNDAQRLSRRVEAPASESHHPVGSQMREVIDESIRGV